MTGIKNILVAHGIRPSLHRLKVLEYVVAAKHHPTPEIIFQDLTAVIPAISLVLPKESFPC